MALGPRTQISGGMASLCLLLFGFMAPTVLYTNTFHKSTFFLLTVRYIVLPLFFSRHIQLPRQGKCHISRNMNADGFLQLPRKCYSARISLTCFFKSRLKSHSYAQRVLYFVPNSEDFDSFSVPGLIFPGCVSD